MRIALLALALVASGALADDTHVRGYTRRDGTYVQPHHRTTPDSNRGNNYGSQGNVNPWTGQAGTINPYAPPQPSVPTYPTYPAYPGSR